MVELVIHGFDPYGTAAQLFAQPNAGGSGGFIVTTNPRTGRAAFNVTTTTTFFRQLFTMSGTTIVIGVAVRWGTVGLAQRVFRTWCNATSRSGIQLNLTATGVLTVGYGGSTSAGGDGATFAGTTLWTGTTSEIAGSYVYYELKAVLSGTATGSWTLRRNGEVVQSQSSVITLANVADVVNGVILEGRTGGDSNFDDLYIFDGSGTRNNDFSVGNKVALLLPTANDTVAMTPLAGTNWGSVSDVTPDDDASYVSAATAGLTDLYVMADLPGTALTVQAVKGLARAKTDATPTSIAPLIRSGGTNSTGTATAIDTNYQYCTAIFGTDPNGGGNWSPASVNGILAGPTRTV